MIVAMQKIHICSCFSLNLSDSESSSDEEMAEVRKKKNATLGNS